MINLTQLTTGYCHTHYLRLLLLLLLSALGLRLAILYEFLNGNPFAEVFYSDAYVYWIMSGTKAAGAWIEETAFLQAPLYPYVLGFVRLLTDSLPVIFSLQLFLGFITVILVADASRRRFGAATSLIATALFAFASEPVMTFTRLLADTTQLFLAALVWWLWVVLAERDKISLFLVTVTSLSIGLLALAWAPAQLLLLVFVLWLLFSNASLPKRLLFATVGLLAGVLMILPATLHNWHVSNEFIPISANGGVNLYQGNKENAHGIVTPIPGMRTVRASMFRDLAQIYLNDTGQHGTWKEIDNHFRQKAIEYITNHPEDMFYLLLRKFDWFLTSMHYDNVSILKLEQEHGLFELGKLAPIHLPWLMGLAALGLILVLQQPYRFAPEIMMVGLTVFVCVAFYYSGRFRLPIAPVLCVLSAMAIVNFRQLKASRFLSFFLIMLPVPLLWINSLTGFASIDFDRQRNHIRVSHAYMEVGDLRVLDGELSAASEQYKKAVEADPGYVTPYLRLAHLELRENRQKAALTWANQGVGGHTDDREAIRMAYNLSLQQKDYVGALKQMQLLLERAPDDQQLRQNYIIFLATVPETDVQEPQMALELIEQLIQQAPPQRLPGLMVTRAIAQKQSGLDKQALNTINRLLRYMKTSRNTRGQKVIKILADDISHKEPLDFQPVIFRIRDPWDGSIEHPMRKSTGQGSSSPAGSSP